jgi:hypothetical protein
MKAVGRIGLGFRLTRHREAKIRFKIGLLLIYVAVRIMGVRLDGIDVQGGGAVVELTQR